MSISGDTPRENLTLTEADLAACRPIVGEGGHVLRALCPFHGSDRQRSLRVEVHSGRFVCFACGAWGYMDTARAQWREEQQRQAAFGRPPAHRQRLTHRRQSPPPRSRPPAAAARPRSADPPAPRASAPARPDLAQQLTAFQAALPDSRGAAHIPPNYVVKDATTQRKPPDVRICRLRNQSRVGTVPPSTSTPHWPACCARR